MAKLNPCNCGNDNVKTYVTLEYIMVFCPTCGRSNKTYGKRRVYTSFSRCINAVESKAIEEWNAWNGRVEHD